MPQQKLFEVRDKRGKERFYLDDVYLNGYAKKCGIYATGVYISLCRHADSDQKCWPSIKRIAEELAISQKQVGRAIKILEDYRIISKERVGKKLNNRYWLLSKSEWTDSPISDKTTSPIIGDSQSDHIGTDSPIIKETHLKETHSKELVSKDTNDKVVSDEVNLIIKKFKKEFDLQILDGSEAVNRRYAWLIFVKCKKNLDMALKVIELAASDDFYSDKFASLKGLYYKMVEIVQRARGRSKKDRPEVLDLSK